MNSSDILSFPIPGPVKNGELYKLPDTPRYVIPEVENRKIGLNNDQVNDLDHQRRLGEVAAWSNAGNALATLHESLQKIDKVISIVDPTLSRKDWDFQLEKGQLVATGDLSDQEKETIGKFLNAMPGLVEAAETLEKSAVNALDVDGNGSAPMFVTNGYTNRYALNYYKGVAEQLDGKVGLRNLLQETTRHVTNNGRTEVRDATSWGMGAMQVIESYLTASKPEFLPLTKPFETP